MAPCSGFLIPRPRNGQEAWHLESALVSCYFTICESPPTSRAVGGNDGQHGKAARPSAIGSCRAGSLRCAPLPIPQRISKSIRDGRKIRKAHRTLRNFELPDRGEIGLPRRLSPMGASAPNWRLIPPEIKKSDRSNPTGAGDLRHRGPNAECRYQDQMACLAFASSMWPATLA
jgi:hypothetical protein